MTASQKQMITIETTVNASIEKVWKMWNAPEHITKWATGSPDWHTPYAENDLRVGGKFLSRMSAKDDSASFDFIGTYDDVQKHKIIAYTMEDGRTAKIVFTASGKNVKIVETFEAETENTLELQRTGWQMILDNFKKHVETTL
ncbi:MAG: SRPBCC family protein [Bacteroidetes bacterium]|nr:SRPBCC family protein [Bacteroidota bacterium]